MVAIESTPDMVAKLYATMRQNLAVVRRLDDLVAYLFRADAFPDGVILSTGTALVPEGPFTLQVGDTVEIEIAGLGTLRNPVVYAETLRVG